jgi:hypothetical protein
MDLIYKKSPGNPPGLFSTRIVIPIGEKEIVHAL